MEPERLPQELRVLPAQEARLRIDATTQLVLLATVSDDGATVHQRSALLVLPRAGEMALVDGLQFSLLLSVHAQLPIQQLLDAMYRDYYRDVMKRASSPIASAVASLQDVCHEALQQCPAELTPDERRLNQRRAASLQFVKRCAPFEPSRLSPIYANLKQQRQWCLTFENHLALQYFIARFARGFKIGRDVAEVRVLQQLSQSAEQRVTYFDYGARDGARRYVLRQLPSFAGPDESVTWSFAEGRALSSRCYVLNGSGDKTPPCAVDWQAIRGEARRIEDGLSLNALDFEPGALPGLQCCLYAHQARRQTLGRDASRPKAPTPPKAPSTTLVHSASPLPTQAPCVAKQQLPGQKRVAQSELTALGIKKARRQ